MDVSGNGMVCTPVGQCPDGAIVREAGWVQCATDAATAKTCINGIWVQSTSPQPTDEYCQPGGLPFGGFSARASCTNGVGAGFSAPVCVSCEPYYALTSNSCNRSCSANNDAKCWSGYHCFSGDDLCYSNASAAANLCDADSDCSSGYCNTSCSTKANNGEACTRALGCTGGSCAHNVCCSGGTCCDPGMTGQCGAFACDATTFSCRTACTGNDNAQCAAGSHCYSTTGQCYSNLDGSLCDSASDCAGGNCGPGNVCVTRPIHSITAQCCMQGSFCNPQPGGGGSGTFRYSRVDASGSLLGAVSPNSPNANQSLFQTSSPVTLTLTTDIFAGSYFAVEGSEGSGSLTCHFTFTAAGGAVVSTETFDVAGSGFVVRNAAVHPNNYHRFFFDGAAVTGSAQTAP